MVSQAKSKKTKKRVGNPAHKIRREKCWARGQKRKEMRREAQHASSVRNKALKRSGGLTPWEEACKARREQRAQVFVDKPKTSTGKRAATRNG